MGSKEPKFVLLLKMMFYGYNRTLLDFKNGGAAHQQNQCLIYINSCFSIIIFENLIAKRKTPLSAGF